MYYNETELVVSFDVDDTLVLHDPVRTDNKTLIKIKDPYMSDNSSVKVYVHQAHVDLLKQFKHRGYTVIVWSAGGSKWANEVIKALKIEEYVDIVITKPVKLFDDLPLNEALGQRIYLEP